jgi:branched-chain amino acid transport system ATP-binding protein
MMADAPILEAQGLTKRYGGLVANNDVSMSLAPGEIRGLIGPNGAGKTTFVNLLTGLETPDAGSVRLDGADITGLPPHRIAAQGLVRTFQVSRVFANLTVRENLLVPFLAAGSPGGVREGEARAAELEAAGVGRVKAGDDVEEGGLAGTVGADDRADLALLELGADVADGGQATEALGEKHDYNHRY